MWAEHDRFIKRQSEALHKFIDDAEISSQVFDETAQAGGNTADAAEVDPPS